MPYGYKAVPDADFPAESLVDFIAQQMKPEFDWKDAEWLCQEWGDTGPVALKGVARGEDAKRWLDIGGKVIWVSNHGGRQLESSVAPFDVLPEVRKAVGPDVEVIMDGGVRRGIDVVKALARGADSVACGRAYLYGLAAGGFEGVDKALTLLSKDVHLAMGLLGCRTVAELKARGPEFMLHKQNSSFVYDNGTGLQPYFGAPPSTYISPSSPCKLTWVGRGIRVYYPPPSVRPRLRRLFAGGLAHRALQVALGGASAADAGGTASGGAPPRAGSRSAPPTRRRAPDRSSPSPRPDT